MGAWLRKVKRRKGGVYLWRVDRHNGRGRVNGYVGETVSFVLRSRQHLGEMVVLTDDNMIRRTGQPWSDLNPRMYRVVKLPWWLCWKWVLRPLETLVIFATWPVYNDKKNRWNPRRITRPLARVQRARRDRGVDVRPRAYVMLRVFTAMLVTVICMAAYVYALYQ